MIRASGRSHLPRSPFSSGDGAETRRWVDVSDERFREITDSALDGLAKRELNLSAIVGKRVEAIERRLVPEVIERLFVAAAPEAGLRPKPP
jgi:hypothetical protein